MNMLINKMNEFNNKEKTKDNLIVKNIIVNKDKSKNQITPFVATEKWIGQLCNRLQVNS